MNQQSRKRVICILLTAIIARFLTTETRSEVLANNKITTCWDEETGKRIAAMLDNEDSWSGVEDGKNTLVCAWKYEESDTVFTLLRFDNNGDIDYGFATNGLSTLVVKGSKLDQVQCYADKNFYTIVAHAVEENELFIMRFDHDGTFLEFQETTEGHFKGRSCPRKKNKIFDNVCVRNALRVAGDLVVCGSIINAGLAGGGTSIPGSTGAVGTTGVTGITGAFGLQGLTGNTGSQGFTGPQGNTGATG